MQVQVSATSTVRLVKPIGLLSFAVCPESGCGAGTVPASRMSIFRIGRREEFGDAERDPRRPRFITK